MIHWKSMRWMAAGFVWGVLTGIAAADDTEIFTQVLPPADPNILFIVDTSGSMDSDVIVSEDFDPKVTYPGNCQAGHVYFELLTGSNDVVPSCAGGEPANFTNLSAFTCNAAVNAFAQVGFFEDRFAQWDDVNDEWTRILTAFAGSPTLGQNRLVECAEDRGVHGDGVDDTKLYPADGVDGPWSSNPSFNIWPVLDRYKYYSANYINWVDSNPPDIVKSRLSVVKDVVNNLLTGASGARIGLMRFSSNGQGGMVVHQVADVATDRDSLIAAMNAMTSGGSTPLAETLYEAQQYLAGRAVDFGLTSVDSGNVPLPSVPGSRNGNTYVSPIAEQCQRSFVVLLTDGLPVNDSDADARIEALPGFADAVGAPQCTDSCLNEMSKYLAETDLSPFAGDQKALTYTIGFTTDTDLLAQTATATKPDGSPAYYQANDLTGLTNAFAQILEDIDAESHTFASPAVSVNSFNRVTNRDDIYFTMFVPSGAPHWAGNVKKYHLGPTVDGSVQVLDADGNVAVDAATGNFLPTARSDWSAEVDGADALKGGVRGRMTADRNIYTDVAGANAGVVLTNPANRFHEDNDQLTAAMLGVPENERAETIRFLRGVDETGDAQPILGESLHGVPLIISYGGTEENPDLMLYFATNDGYFHAVDPTPDTDAEDLEKFAFIPSAMLPNLAGLLDNVASNPIHKAYGLDGPLTYWIDNDDNDNVVETANGEQLFVYVGMRRGGRNYYALDLTDRTDPRLAWTIEGGKGDFTELGQSWSAATVAKINVGGTPRTVLIFGGGYDTRQDTAGPPLADGIGRAVYIVDAETGARLWWAANAADDPNADLPLADMTNSIPSEVRVIDTNSDGFADRMYVGDMGGRVWRFDIDNASNQAGHLAVTGAVLASLGGADAAGNRRFYYAPSVSQIIDERAGSFLTVSIGSGHRENPLGTGVSDRFYMLRDPHVFGPARDLGGNAVYPAALTEGSLLDVTADVAPQVDALNQHSGWFIRLTDAGEKVLASAFTADSKIFFTTYLPTVNQAPTCDLAGVIGSGRLYSVSLLTGAPVIFTDVMTPEDRHEDLARGGIPPAPVPVFTIPECQGDACGDQGGPGGPGNGGGGGGQEGCANPFSQVTLLIATEARDPRICNAPTRTYWHEKSSR
jgi:type IV pilus assembly protein PilY1